MWANEKISFSGMERVCLGVEVREDRRGRSELEQPLGHKVEKSALQNHEIFLNMAVPGNLK